MYIYYILLLLLLLLFLLLLLLLLLLYYKGSNIPRNVRVSYPRSRDSQGQEMFLAPSSEK